jgi:hypothetical protein
MTRDIHRIDLTTDFVDRNERLANLAYRPAKDHQLTKLDYLAWIMLGVLFVGWVIYNI